MRRRSSPTSATYDKVAHNVIEPAMKAACQNEGAKYTAKELIQGTTRSQVPGRPVQHRSRQQVAARNIHVLLALIRNITIKDTTGKDADRRAARDDPAGQHRDRARPDQQAEDRDRRQEGRAGAGPEAGGRRAGDGRQRDGRKGRQHPRRRQQAGRRDRRRARPGGREDRAARSRSWTPSARRSSARPRRTSHSMKNEAEAKGAKLLVDAFGSPQAYNQYIFAKNFEPTELKSDLRRPRHVLDGPEELPGHRRRARCWSSRSSRRSRRRRRSEPL